VIHVYGVDVEVIDAGIVPIFPQLAVSLVEAYVIQAAPFEEEFPGLYVELLDDALHRQAVNRTTDRGKVLRHHVVDRDQCRVLRADQELVVVPFVTVCGPEAGDLAVGTIEDNVHPGCFAPGEHGLPTVCLHPEVHGPS
jgi:hypothetical protein